MITPDGWTIASQANSNCVGARRIARSTDIQVCETDRPDHVVQVTQAAFVDFLASVKAGTFKPTYDGPLVMFTIADRLRPEHRPIVTTVDNWRTFQNGVRTGKFDTLPPVPLGLGHGQWMTPDYGRTSKTV